MCLGNILIQKHQLGGNDQAPPKIPEIGLAYKKQLRLLNTVRYKQCIKLKFSIESQLHGFCDAIEKAGITIVSSYPLNCTSFRSKQ